MKRWLKNWRFIIRDFLSTAGSLWLFIKISDFFFHSFTQQHDTENDFLLFVVVSLIVGIIKNFPKSSCSQKIRGHDSFIELRIGDGFENLGALVVPINDEFDVSLDGNVKKAQSIQNRLIESYYLSKEDHLKKDIEGKIDLQSAPFPMGTVVEVEQKGKRFYLLANSVKNPNNRSSSTINDFLAALNGIWDFLAKNATKGEVVTIPLINTQNGRNSDLTREAVIKQIIDSFIEESKHRAVCEKLIISVYPADLERGGLDFEYLSEYLKFQCLNYKDTKFNPKPEGKEIESSDISNIQI